MVYPFLFSNKQSKKYYFFHIVLFSCFSIFVATSNSDLVFAQHDHGSSSSGSESGGAGSFIGLDGYQALVELSEIGNCYGCNNNTNSQVLTIFKHGTEDFPFLKGGVMFMISPNPYAFTNFDNTANPQFFGPNLIISDNDPLDYDPTLGVIELIRVNPGVYSVWELKGPPGLIKNNAPHSSAEVTVSNYPKVPVTNLFLDLSSGPQFVLPPPLSTSDFDVMKEHNPLVNGKPLTYLPSSIITSKNTMYSVQPPNNMIFEKMLPNAATNWNIFERFSNLGIPNYGELSIGNSGGVYIPPIFVGQNTDGSTFLTTPKFSNVDFNTNMLLRFDSIIQYDGHHGTHGASLLGVYLPLAVSGTDFGVSLQVNNEPPRIFPNLDPGDGFEALFFDLKAIGNINLNNPGSFSENPSITFFLDRNTNNSCMQPSTVTVFLYDSGHWHPVEINGEEPFPTLVPALHTATQCAYEQKVEHFSSFLIGTSTSPQDHSDHDGGSHSDHGNHDSGEHSEHEGMTHSYALDECTVNGLIRDIYNKNVYLQIHTNSDGNKLTNTGPGDFFNPGEVRGQIQYVYGSKLFTTTAKPGNEILSNKSESILWATSTATASAIFDSSKFNELQYTVSGRSLSNVVGISLYLGNQYENSDIRLVDIISPDTENIHLNFDTIKGKITNDDLCNIAQNTEHDMSSHLEHPDESVTDENNLHESHEVSDMEEKGIMAPSNHSNHVVVETPYGTSITCYDPACMDPEPTEILAINGLNELPVTLLPIESSTQNSEFDFGNSFSGNRILANIFDTTFPIVYNLNGKLTKMTINEQNKSLSLYLENVSEDEFSIRIPREMIDADDNNFLVMITASPEQMSEYEIVSSDKSFFIMKLIVPENTSKITVIGAKVIPEFGVIVTMILIISIASTILVTKFRIIPKI